MQILDCLQILQEVLKREEKYSADDVVQKTKSVSYFKNAYGQVHLTRRKIHRCGEEGTEGFGEGHYETVAYT